MNVKLHAFSWSMNSKMKTTLFKPHLLREKVLKFFILLLMVTFAQCQPPKEDPVIRPVDQVYPLLDTENSRWFYFDAASRPFGMVNLSPDTELNGAWSSGYQYDIDTIKGFSHIHAWQLSGVSVMPIVSSKENDDFTDFYSKFSHDKEEVKVGYHKVALERHGIQAELTTTHRVGFHRYKYPKEPAAVLFNFEGQLGPSKIKEGNIQLEDRFTISGKTTVAPTRRRPKDFDIYFVVTFSQAIEEVQVSPHSKNRIVTFGELEKPLLMKVALSYTSSENARLNLQEELDHWDFEQVVDDAQNEWNELLSRVAVKGGDSISQRRFYTDLWHALQGRREINDVNGAYPDNTGEAFRVGQLPLDENGKPVHRQFNSDAFYGTHWSINTLWGLLYPDIYEEFVNSLLQYYQDGGLIPRGPSGGNYTYVMTGSCMTSFIVSAYQKGIHGFDAGLAYKGLRKNHMPGGMMSHCGYEHYSTLGGGVEEYIEKGYVPHPRPKGIRGNQKQGAGMTLEYAYQDWVLAQLAKELGEEDDYNYFMNRSGNYKNLWDDKSGWIRPKDRNGNWREPFDPYEYNAGLIESNAAQFTWSVPHDLEGLAELMGGKKAAAYRLNEQFEQASKLGYTSGTSHEVETSPENRRIPINYGNQESMQTGFIFNYLDRPDLTQYWTRRVVDEVYAALSPARGFNGDEDQGLMGALSVLLKIGLFQMNGGTEKDPSYDIGSPIFDEISLKLHPDYYAGATFSIKAANNAPDHPYVKHVKLNSEEITTYKINHSDIVNGGELTLEMTSNHKLEE